MRKEKIIEFFDTRADSWDKNSVINEQKLNVILDIAQINENDTVLDVACGTGVLFPFYLERKVKKATGVDFSRNMIDIAKKKFNGENVCFFCADIETLALDEKVGKAVIFNAFPHFIEAEKIIENITKNMQNNGRLTIAHDMGRSQLDKHHSSAAKEVSKKLIPAEETAKLIKKYIDVDTIIDQDDIYVVSGTVKK